MSQSTQNETTPGTPSGRFALGMALAGVIIPLFLAVLIAGFGNGSDTAYVLCVVLGLIFEAVALVAGLQAGQIRAGKWAVIVAIALLLCLFAWFAMSWSPEPRFQNWGWQQVPGQPQQPADEPQHAHNHP